MPTIHDDIEPWLAAAVHDQLSTEERTALQEHLAECETCRALHAQTLAMNKMIASSLDHAKPDLAFEQRVVSAFRRKTPHRSSIIAGLGGLWRSRATQLVGAAALLLTLVQVGRVVTQESPAVSTFSNFQETVSAPDAVEQAGSEMPASPVETAMLDAQEKKRGNSADNLRQRSMSAAKSAPLMARPVPAQDAPQAFEPEPLESVKGSAPPPTGGAGAPVVPPDANRKLIRNAQVEIEIAAFGEAVERITALTTEAGGYVATSSSNKQANGKLRGTVVVKVLPDRLDAFLAKLRELGEVKNQTLGTDDVTKQYLDTESRLNNARVMEQRLIEILKTKSNKIADLLEVEKELGRVRAEIERMQGELKYMDALVAFATVTITLTEKDMDEPAAFLLKRRAQLALFSTDVEKTFAEVKAIVDGAKAQVSSSTLDRDSTGEATARLVLLIVPEEADALINRIKGMGRVQNYNEQTDRIAQGGSGMAQGAKVERDKVELSITISRNEQEPALQTTSLRILTGKVTERVAQLKETAAQSGAEIRSSSFSRTPDGQELANISLRLPMKNYAALMSSLDQLGKVRDVSVQRDDRRGTIDEATAPADVNIQVYSQPDIVSDESGLIATVRRTLMQGVAALMWSLRMIGVALAFFAPWVLALGLVGWIFKLIVRRRKVRREKDAVE